MFGASFRNWFGSNENRRVVRYLLRLAKCVSFWQGLFALLELTLDKLPELKPQEIPLKHPDSNNMFLPGPNKPFLATPAAIEMYSHEVIIECWKLLRGMANQYHGIDYLQVFESNDHDENLWFIEDGPGGAITALLPSDY